MRASWDGFGRLGFQQAQGKPQGRKVREAKTSRGGDRQAVRRAAAAEQDGGAKRYDDRIIRARLAQAFGRLIRTREDSGHFVVLSPAFPTRLLSAFPKGTPVTRLTLEEALQRVANGVVSPEHSPAEKQPQ